MALFCFRLGAWPIHVRPAPLPRTRKPKPPKEPTNRHTKTRHKTGSTRSPARFYCAIRMQGDCALGAMYHTYLRYHGPADCSSYEVAFAAEIRGLEGDSTLSHSVHLPVMT